MDLQNRKCYDEKEAFSPLDPLFSLVPECFVFPKPPSLVQAFAPKPTGKAFYLPAKLPTNCLRILPRTIYRGKLRWSMLSPIAIVPLPVSSHDFCRLNDRTFKALSKARNLHPAGWLPFFPTPRKSEHPPKLFFPQYLRSWKAAVCPVILILLHESPQVHSS